MDKFITFFPDKKIAFYIASNEPIQEEIFDGLDYRYINNASSTQDLYALSKCHYLIGTLSSYNSWVSLVWERPLFTITDIKELETFRLHDFGIVLNYAYKDNGWEFPRSETFFKQVLHPFLYRHSNDEHIRIKDYT